MLYINYYQLNNISIFVSSENPFNGDKNISLWNQRFFSREKHNKLWTDSFCRTETDESRRRLVEAKKLIWHRWFSQGFCLMDYQKNSATGSSVFLWTSALFTINQIEVHTHHLIVFKNTLHAWMPGIIKEKINRFIELEWWCIKIP